MLHQVVSHPAPLKAFLPVEAHRLFQHPMVVICSPPCQQRELSASRLVQKGMVRWWVEQYTHKGQV